MFLLLVVMLDRLCSDVECKTTGYPLHSPLFPSFPLPCVTVCQQVSAVLCDCEMDCTGSGCVAVTECFKNNNKKIRTIKNGGEFFDQLCYSLSRRFLFSSMLDTVGEQCGE